MTIKRLDAVSIFNNKLTFLIPHEWINVEFDENDAYQYQLSNATCGFFRVSLITGHGPAEKLRESFQKAHGNVEVNPTTGNLIARSEKVLTQDGTPIHIHYWFVGGSVGPDAICEAVFSYTVLAHLHNDSETQSDVQIIGQLVADARFEHPA